MAKQVLIDLEKPQRVPVCSTSSKSSSCHNDSPPAAKKISFSIVVISVPLLYVSLLHTSSPYSSLFNDTKFWFLMSNAIILIVAADSGMFAGASDDPAEIYQEYHYPKHTKPNSDGGLIPRGEPPGIQWRGKEPNASLAQLAPSQGSVPQKDDGQTSKERPARIVPELAAPTDDHAVESKGDQKKVCEESEYAAMSDEELNRRVEEFIRRFNREIRRQEGTSESLLVCSLN